MPELTVILKTIVADEFFQINSDKKDLLDSIFDCNPD